MIVDKMENGVWTRTETESKEVLCKIENLGNNIYWFINSKGYLHVLRPSIEKMNGRIVNYIIKDFMLTKDNMLQDKGVLHRFSTIEEVYNKMEELINE